MSGDIHLRPPGEDRARARRIVKLAAAKTTTTYLKAWFLRDENGHWEKGALDALHRLAPRAAELGMTAEQFDDEIAGHLFVLGATALIERASKKGKV